MAESCVIPCRNQSGELREIPRSVPPNDGLHRPSPSQGSPALGPPRSQQLTQLVGFARGSHAGPEVHPHITSNRALRPRTPPSCGVVLLSGLWQSVPAPISTPQATTAAHCWKNLSTDPLFQTQTAAFLPREAAAPNPSELQQGGRSSCTSVALSDTISIPTFYSTSHLPPALKAMASSGGGMSCRLHVRGALCCFLQFLTAAHSFSPSQGHGSALEEQHKH